MFWAIVGAIVLMFAIFVSALKVLSRIQEKRDQEFKQRIDRYRRGHS